MMDAGSSSEWGVPFVDTDSYMLADSDRWYKAVTDQDKRTFTVRRVLEGNDYWAIVTDSYWWYSFSKEAGIVPQVGDTVTFYGRGFGYAVRGLDINGQEVFYRTPEQQLAWERSGNAFRVRSLCAE